MTMSKYINPLMHNVPKWSHFKNLAANVNAARFLKCV